MDSKTPSFGELDLGWDEVSETATPVSGVRQARIVPGLAARDSSRPLASADMTRIGDSPLEAGMLEADPRSAGTMEDPRLDQVRALYARGDTAAALAFAEKMSSDKPAALPPAARRSSPPSQPVRQPVSQPVRQPVSQPPPGSARSFAQTVTAAVRTAPLPRAPEPYADIQDEGAPADHPSDHEHGTAIFAAGAGEALMQVASLTGTPYIAMALQEVQRLPLDPRAGFLMSIIDGASTIPDLCDLAGMPEDEVVSVLTELARHKVIAFK